MRERWVSIAVGMTAGLGSIALALTPDWSASLGTTLLIVVWVVAAMAVTMLLVIGAVFSMMLRGVEGPIAVSIAFLRENRRRLATVAALTVLAGLNMIAFLLAKPLLNYYVPFNADPLLASLDAALFAGPPARFLLWLNTTPLAIFYHRGWFVLLIAALLLTLWQSPSQKKSAVMLTYFLLWSIAGPLTHILLPAAGPVFYAALGYGSQFEGMFNEPKTLVMVNFLWRIYSEQGIVGGSGISAMPSLHIATTTWACLAVWIFAPRWRMLTITAGLLIFALSVSLGWHYAFDGIVGAILALGTYFLLTELGRDRKSLTVPCMSTETRRRPGGIAALRMTRDRD